jgi:hypothetical protein
VSLKFLYGIYLRIKHEFISDFDDVSLCWPWCVEMWSFFFSDKAFSLLHC